MTTPAAMPNSILQAIAPTLFCAEEDRLRLTHGSLRVDLSGRMAKFSLHNPLSKGKMDLIFFHKTGLLLAEYLREAYFVVGKLNDGTMATPATNAEGGDVALDPHAAEPVPPQQYYYNQILSVYGSNPPMETRLYVQLYKERPYVWVKNFFLNTVTMEFQPCIGGFQFDADRDRPDDIRAFVLKYNQ